LYSFISVSQHKLFNIQYEECPHYQQPLLLYLNLNNVTNKYNNKQQYKGHSVPELPLEILTYLKQQCRSMIL
jgi:hypothetical protein